MDPKKLRAPMKLNLSTEVTFTLTFWLKMRLKVVWPELVVVPSSTLASVVRHGGPLSETKTPLKRLS